MQAFARGEIPSTPAYDGPTDHLPNNRKSADHSTDHNTTRSSNRDSRASSPKADRADFRDKITPKKPTAPTPIPPDPPTVHRSHHASHSRVSTAPHRADTPHVPASPPPVYPLRHQPLATEPTRLSSVKHSRPNPPMTSHPPPRSDPGSPGSARSSSNSSVGSSSTAQATTSLNMALWSPSILSDSDFRSPTIENMTPFTLLPPALTDSAPHGPRGAGPVRGMPTAGLPAGGAPRIGTLGAGHPSLQRDTHDPTDHPHPAGLRQDQDGRQRHPLGPGPSTDSRHSPSSVASMDHRPDVGHSSVGRTSSVGPSQGQSYRDRRPPSAEPYTTDILARPRQPPAEKRTAGRPLSVQNPLVPAASPGQNHSGAGAPGQDPLGGVGTHSLARPPPAGPLGQHPTYALPRPVSSMDLRYGDHLGPRPGFPPSPETRHDTRQENRLFHDTLPTRDTHPPRDTLPPRDTRHPPTQTISQTQTNGPFHTALAHTFHTQTNAPTPSHSHGQVNGVKTPQQESRVLSLFDDVETFDDSDEDSEEDLPPASQDRHQNYAVETEPTVVLAPLDGPPVPQPPPRNQSTQPPPWNQSQPPPQYQSKQPPNPKSQTALHEQNSHTRSQTNNMQNHAIPTERSWSGPPSNGKQTHGKHPSQKQTKHDQTSGPNGPILRPNQGQNSPPPACSPASRVAKSGTADYDDKTLQDMSYAVLASQSFDFDPAQGPEELSSAKVSHGESLPAKLDHYRGKPPGDQQQFFVTMTVSDWERSGDWFLDRFGALVQQMKTARQARRQTVADLEAEVAAREEVVRAHHDETDRRLSRMKQKGTRLVEETD